MLPGVQSQELSYRISAFGGQFVPRGLRILHIITGHGEHRSGLSVVRTAVLSLLRAVPFVMVEMDESNPGLLRCIVPKESRGFRV